MSLHLRKAVLLDFNSMSYRQVGEAFEVTVPLFELVSCQIILSLVYGISSLCTTQISSMHVLLQTNFYQAPIGLRGMEKGFAGFKNWLVYPSSLGTLCSVTRKTGVSIQVIT